MPFLGCRPTADNKSTSPPIRGAVYFMGNRLNRIRFRIRHGWYCEAAATSPVNTTAVVSTFYKETRWIGRHMPSETREGTHRRHSQRQPTYQGTTHASHCSLYWYCTAVLPSRLSEACSWRQPNRCLNSTLHQTTYLQRYCVTDARLYLRPAGQNRCTAGVARHCTFRSLDAVPSPLSTLSDAAS